MSDIDRPDATGSGPAPDQPTVAFPAAPAASDDALTEVLSPGGAPPSAPPPSSTGGDGDRRRPTLWIVIAILGGLLLIAIGVLVGVLLSGGGEPAASPEASPSATATATRTPTPTRSPTATATPSPTPTSTETSDPAPPPPPPPPDPSVGVIDSFAPTADPEQQCAATGESFVEVTFTWSTTNAAGVAFGIDTMDAFLGPYQLDLPASGSITVNHPCGDPQRYTLSVFGSNGVVHSEYWLYNQ